MHPYEVEWAIGRKYVSVADEESGYTLSLILDVEPVRWTDCTVNACNPRVNSLYITDRDFKDYDHEIQGLDINPDFQYIEVGAGLGEFVPKIIQEFGRRLRHRPIVIDPADYRVMRGLLDFAKTLPVRALASRLGELSDRCDIMLDNDAVNLVNLRLKDALRRHRELIGTGDILVYNAGASHYTPYKSAWALERRLLKPSGVLYSAVINRKGVLRPH